MNERIKEFFGWLSWVWRNWETWQKLWVVALFFIGMSLGLEGTARNVVIIIPITIFGYFMFKWAVVDTFKSSWTKYREHRNELLTTIKNSDAKE